MATLTTAKKLGAGKGKDKTLRLVIDGGNSFVKVQCNGINGLFPHAIAELTKIQWEEAIKQYGSNKYDFIKIGSTHYVVGETAEHYHTIKVTGRAKYTRDYYGVLFASAVARMFFDGSDALQGGLEVMASHPPADYQFSDNLVDSIKGKWSFWCGGLDYKFEVVNTDTYYEPFGSYAHKAFIPTANGKYSYPLYGVSVGVIDVGGGTISVLGVDSFGNVEQKRSDNGTIGINDVLTTFKAEIQHSHHDFFARAKNIPTTRLRDALLTGIYKGGGKELDCTKEAERAFNPLLNEIENLYIVKLDAGIGLDQLYITGGGSVIAEKRIIDVLKHDRVELADIPKNIQFTNVSGADHFAEMLERIG